MPLFGRSSSAGSSFFQKVKSGIGSAVGTIGRLAGGVSNIASRAGDILGKVSSVANSPLAQQIIGAVAPSQLGNLNKVQNALASATNITSQVGGIAGKVGDITSAGTYFGQNPVPALRNAVERAKDIREDVMGLVANPFTPNLSNPRMVGGNSATFTPMAFR